MWSLQKIILSFIVIAVVLGFSIAFVAIIQRYVCIVLISYLTCCRLVLYRLSVMFRLRAFVISLLYCYFIRLIPCLQLRLCYPHYPYFTSVTWICCAFHHFPDVTCVKHVRGYLLCQWFWRTKPARPFDNIPDTIQPIYSSVPIQVVVCDPLPTIAQNTCGVTLLTS